VTALIVSATNASASLGAVIYPASRSAELTPPTTAAGASTGPSLSVSVGLLAPPIISLLIQNAAASATSGGSSESFYAAAAYAATNALSPTGFTAIASENLAQEAEGQTSYFGPLGASAEPRTTTPTAQEDTLAAATLNSPTSVFAALEQAKPSVNAG